MTASKRRALAGSTRYSISITIGPLRGVSERCISGSARTSRDSSFGPLTVGIRIHKPRTGDANKVAPEMSSAPSTPMSTQDLVRRQREGAEPRHHKPDWPPLLLWVRLHEKGEPDRFRCEFRKASRRVCFQWVGLCERRLRKCWRFPARKMHRQRNGAKVITDAQVSRCSERVGSIDP